MRTESGRSHSKHSGAVLFSAMLSGRGVGGRSFGVAVLSLVAGCVEPPVTWSGPPVTVARPEGAARLVLADGKAPTFARGEASALPAVDSLACPGSTRVASRADARERYAVWWAPQGRAG